MSQIPITDELWIFHNEILSKPKLLIRYLFSTKRGLWAAVNKSF
jgi:hypothetical protein